MTARWWSCVLGLLCLPAEVILYSWTVSQSPMSTSHMKINSSAEIKCSTSLSDPMGVVLVRRFHSDREILHLNMKDGIITKNTTANEFHGRIHIVPDMELRQGLGLTFHLSLLELTDTDMYYCRWNYYTSWNGLEAQSSNGTILIITEKGPREQCPVAIVDLVLIFLTVMSFIVIMFLITAGLFRKCKFRKTFRTGRFVKSYRPNSPQCVCAQQSFHHTPYMTTSTSTLDIRVFQLR